jgi:hypothetical protein
MCSIINQNLVEIRNYSQVLALIRHFLNQGVADPDPFFHFDAEPEPDLASHQSDANLRSLVYRPSTAPF